MMVQPGDDCMVRIYGNTYAGIVQRIKRGKRSAVVAFLTSNGWYERPFPMITPNKHGRVMTWSHQPTCPDGPGTVEDIEHECS